MFSAWRRSSGRLALFASGGGTFGSLVSSSRCENASPSKPISTKKRVVIIGGGVMGASTAWQLTGRGEQLHVTLIDANHPIRGSWHESRIARAAYEDPLYVKMVLRALEHWHRLEKEAGKGQIIYNTGILDIGEPQKLQGYLACYKELGMPVEVFSGRTAEQHEQFIKRFPTIRLAPTQDAVYQKDTHMLAADVCVQAMLELAETRGALLLPDDAACRIDRANKTVTTRQGVVCPYDILILAAGPWTNAVLSIGSLDMLPLVVSNEQAVYLQMRPGVNPDAMAPDKSPVVVEHDYNTYSVPHLPGGVAGCKIGAHAAGEFMHNSEFVLPAGARPLLKQLEQPDQRVHAEQSDEIHVPMLRAVQAMARQNFPLLDPDTGHDTYTRCLYQNLMRDSRKAGADRMSEFSSDFACGPHPQDPSVLVTAGYTGEGFKFGPVLGELLADMVLGVREERVPDMRRRLALDNGSLELFPPEGRRRE